MTDRELMQQALDAMLNFPNDISDEMFESIRVIRARLAQPEQEPVAWVCESFHAGEKHMVDFDQDDIDALPVGTKLYPAPPHFLDPAKVARLMDEAFERGKKEVDMEQVKDIAQKLADCAVLNSALPQREWQGLTENEIKHLWYEACQTNLELTSQLIVHLARNIEAKLREKNHAI